MCDTSARLAHDVVVVPPSRAAREQGVATTLTDAREEACALHRGDRAVHGGVGPRSGIGDADPFGEGVDGEGAVKLCSGPRDEPPGPREASPRVREAFDRICLLVDSHRSPPFPDSAYVRIILTWMSIPFGLGSMRFRGGGSGERWVGEGVLIDGMTRASEVEPVRWGIIGGREFGDLARLRSRFEEACA